MPQRLAPSSDPEGAGPHRNCGSAGETTFSHRAPRTAWATRLMKIRWCAFLVGGGAGSASRACSRGRLEVPVIVVQAGRHVRSLLPDRTLTWDRIAL